MGSKIKNIFSFKKNKRALSLIEVAIAVSILALVCTGTMVVFSQGYELAKQSRELSTAVFFARGIAEDYFDWSVVGAMNGSYSNPPNVLIQDNVTYLPVLLVSNSLLAPPGTSLKVIDVTVNWGTAQSFELRTLKANY